MTAILKPTHTKTPVASTQVALGKSMENLRLLAPLNNLGDHALRLNPSSLPVNQGAPRRPRHP